GPRRETCRTVRLARLQVGAWDLAAVTGDELDDGGAARAGGQEADGGVPQRDAHAAPVEAVEAPAALALHPPVRGVDQVRAVGRGGAVGAVQPVLAEHEVAPAAPLQGGHDRVRRDRLLLAVDVPAGLAGDLGEEQRVRGAVGDLGDGRHHVRALHDAVYAVV